MKSSRISFLFVLAVTALLSTEPALAARKGRGPKPQPSPSATPVPTATPTATPQPSVAPPDSFIGDLPAPKNFAWGTLCSTESWVRFQYDSTLYDIQKFEFYRSTTGAQPQLVGTTVPNSLATTSSCYYNEYKFSGLTDWNTYAFYAVAVDGQGRRSAPASITIATPGMFCASMDSRPSYLMFDYVNPTPGTLKARWQAPTTDPTVTRYRVYLSSGGSATQYLSDQVTDFGNGQFGYTIDGLLAWTQYCVSVTAINASGAESAPMQKCMPTTGAAPSLY